MKGLNQLIGELFNYVDEARHALDELTLLEAMIQQLNGSKGWVSARTLRLKQRSYNARVTAVAFF